MDRAKQDDYHIIIDNINKFLLAYPNAEWGPAHIVLSDHNLGTGHIQWCLDLINAVLKQEEPSERDHAFLNSVHWYETHTKMELEKTKIFLLGLLKTSEEAREPEALEWVRLDN